MPDVNELHEAWRHAPQHERDQKRNLLFAGVLGYARALIWKQLHENNPDLEQVIAQAAFKNLEQFEGGAKFSTWVYRIARNEIVDEIDARTRQRERPTIPIDEVLQPDERPRQPIEPVDPYAQVAETAVLLRELREVLKPEAADLLLGMYENADQNELAEDLGCGVEALQTRRIRLRPKLQKKITLP